MFKAVISIKSMPFLKMERLEGYRGSINASLHARARTALTTANISPPLS